jgi:hypothetical protein
MAPLTIWNWIAICTLFVSALGVAIEGIVRRFPEAASKVHKSRIGALLSFGPLVLVSLAALLVIWRPIGKPAEPVFPVWPDPYSPTLVLNETFTNEVVLLDGSHYIGCTFNNVTFKYNGTTPVNLSNSTVNGDYELTTDNLAVEGAVALLYGFGAVQASRLKLNFPQKSLVVPPDPQP